MNNDELRKLAEAATPGPWNVDAHKNIMKHGKMVAFPCISAGFDQSANAALIAAANPAKIIELLNTIEQQRKLLVRALVALERSEPVRSINYAAHDAIETEIDSHLRQQEGDKHE